VGAPGEARSVAAPERRVGRVAWLALLAVLAAAHVAHRRLLPLEHLGWDTWPLIASSRAASLGDVAAAFTEPLMRGRYPLGEFYRPVTSLAFALDHALWGSAPFGYHLTNHLILLAGVGAAFLATRRLAGGTRGPLVAALVFALHPIHLATLPMAARRADMLSALFTMLALAALPRPAARLSAPRAALLLALGYAAAASKETGIVLLALAAGLAFIEAEGPFVARARGALRAWPAAAGVLLLALSRTLVLGGIGGHAGTGVRAALRATPAVIQNLFNVMLDPVPPLYGRTTLGVAALALALALWILRHQAGRVSLFLAWWLFALSTVTGLAGELRTWYACPYLPLYAALAGVLAGGAAKSLAALRPLQTTAAGLAALFLAAAPLRHSALLEDYDEWRMLSILERTYLDETRAALEQAAPGSAVPTGPLPRALPSKLAGMRAVGLEHYSVQAWADVELPERRVRVTLDPDEPARAHEVLLRIPR
jgi:hypothetical protein